MVHIGLLCSCLRFRDGDGLSIDLRVKVPFVRLAMHRKRRLRGMTARFYWQCLLSQEFCRCLSNFHFIFGRKKLPILLARKWKLAKNFLIKLTRRARRLQATFPPSFLLLPSTSLRINVTSCKLRMMAIENVSNDFSWRERAGRLGFHDFAAF